MISSAVAVVVDRLRCESRSLLAVIRGSTARLHLQWQTHWVASVERADPYTLFIYHVTVTCPHSACASSLTPTHSFPRFLYAHRKAPLPMLSKGLVHLA